MFNAVLDDSDSDSEGKEQEQPELESEREHLSQKLSQLVTSKSASVTDKRPATTPTTPPETTDEHNEESIPKYLSPTVKTFKQMIMPFLSQEAATLVDELREMAILEHRLQMVDLDILLWTCYLQSGTGKLHEQLDSRAFLQQFRNPPPNPVRVWPKQLKDIIITDRHVDSQTKRCISDETYVYYVTDKLTQYQQQFLHYETQIQERRKYLQPQLTTEMEYAIVQFVEEHGIALRRIVIEGLIATVEYNYMDRILELEFQHEDLHREHINTFELLWKSKKACETAKMDVELLKQRVAHQQISSFFDSSQLPAPPTQLKTIQNESIRQRLTYRYEQLLQRMKSEMIVLHIRTAEVKLEEYTKQFEVDLKSSTTTGFTQAMSNIMDRRFKLIEQRLEFLYTLKVRFFVKAPTVNQQH